MVVTLDDENSREFPTSVDMFKPIRQAVYSVLLNLNKLKYLHEQNKEKGNFEMLLLNIIILYKLRFDIFNSDCFKECWIWFKFNRSKEIKPEVKILPLRFSKTNIKKHWTNLPVTEW